MIIAVVDRDAANAVLSTSVYDDVSSAVVESSKRSDEKDVLILERMGANALLQRDEIPFLGQCEAYTVQGQKLWRYVSLSRIREVHA